MYITSTSITGACSKYVSQDGTCATYASCAGASLKGVGVSSRETDPSLTLTCFVSLQAMADLDWKPEFDLIEGLTDSYQKDFGKGTYRKEADFSTDDMVLEKVKSKEHALA